MIKRHLLAYLLCWHGKQRRRVVTYSNGADLYCGTCGLKFLSIWDIGGSHE